MTAPHALRPFDAGHDGIRVTAAAARDGATLRLRYTVDAPPGAVRPSPAAAQPARTDRLWEHSCCEAFIAIVDDAAYWEINAATSGAWNVYRFDHYRSGMRPEPHGGVTSSTITTARGWTSTVSWNAPAGLRTAALDVGLATVLEHADGTRSFWALTHVAAQPDFHQRSSFTVRLPAVEVRS